MTQAFDGLDIGTPVLNRLVLFNVLDVETTTPIPHLGEAPMEAAILVHVHPLGPSFRPGGGQALPLPTVNLLI